MGQEGMVLIRVHGGYKVLWEGKEGGRDAGVTGVG